MKKAISVVVLIISVVLIGLIPVKPKEKPPAQPLEAEENTKIILTGFALSPKSSEGKDLLDYFDRIKNTSKVVSWTGKVEDLKNSKSSAYAVTTLAQNYDYTPIIITDRVDKQLLLDFAGKVKPPYLGVGNEINRGKVADIQKFAKDFEEIYPEIKNVSPDTKIFPVFQLEILDWQLMDLFPKADAIAFTTYPSLIYKTLPEIPEDHYSAIKTHTEKPILFTEVGWPNESDEKEQSDFINFFKENVKILEPEVTLWTFMYDQNVQKPFDRMGLIDKSGKEKKRLEDLD